MKFAAAHMNYVLVEMWYFFQQKSDSVIVDVFKKTNLLPLLPPDYNTNAQACIAATQTPSGTKSEEIEDIARASMAHGEVESIRNTEPMCILIEKVGLWINLLIQYVSYDTVQYRTILPIQ